MNFEQLNYFISIVENKTYLDAAYSMNISQSSLSKQIIKLEKELDTTLFDRSYRSATLTEAGKVFYEDAKKLVEQYDNILQNLDNFKKTNKLHIGMIPIKTQYNLNSIFKEFQKKNNNIELKITEDREENLVEGLLNNKYDLAISRDITFNHSKFNMLYLKKDELVVVLSKKHKFASYKKLTFEQLKDENFILMQPYTSINKLCLNLMKKHKINPPILRTARLESIIGDISINEGLSLLPKSYVQLFNNPSITTVPLKAPVDLSVVIAKNKNKSDNPNVDKLLKFLINEKKNPKS